MSKDSELKNLKEQEKLLSNLMDLQKNHVDSLKKSQEIQESINKTSEIKNKLEAMGIKTTNQWYDTEIKLKKVKEEIISLSEKEIDANNKINETKKKKVQYEEESEYAVRKQLESLEKQLNKELDIIEGKEVSKHIEEEIRDLKLDVLAASEGLSKEEKKRAIAQNEKIKALQKELEYEKKLKEQEKENERLAKKQEEGIKAAKGSIKIPGLNVSVGDLKNKNELGLKANLISAAVDTFNSAVKVFSNAVKDGFNNQRNSYEANFTNIAARTGMSSSTYRSNQMALGGFGKNVLHEQGLMNNVATSEVQNMWNSLANTGMNQEQILANALDNVITNKVVPYLDTTSTDINLLNNRLGGNFIKDIRGINKANLDMAGNNYATKELLQTIIDEVQPMSDEALQNLTQGSEEMTAFINKMIDSGVSKDAALSYATQLFKTQKYSDQVLTSGNITESLPLINSMLKDINIYDPTQFNNYLGEAVDTTQMIAGFGRGYGSTSNGLMTNIVGSAFGENYARLQGAYALKSKGLTGYDLANMTDMTSADAKKYSNSATSDLANDKLQTTKQMTDILAENLTNEVSAFAELLGPWFDVLTTAVKGILIAIAAQGVANVGGKILGIGGKAAGGVGIAQGLANFGAGGISNIGATGSAATTVSAGTVAAGVAGVAGVAGGVAMASDGATKAYKAFEEGETGVGVGRTVQAAGGAIGAGALLALGVSNPIGWVALAVGGLAAVATSAYETANSYKKAGKAVEKEWDNYAYGLKGEIREREKSILAAQEYLEDEKNTEKARTELLNSGMLTEEDMQKAQNASREELMKLTEQYKISTKDFSGASTEVINELKGKQSGSANDTVKSIQDWIKGDASKNYNDANLQLLTDLRDKMVERIEAKGDSASDDEKEYLKRVNSNKGKQKNGQADILWEFNSWDDGYKSIATALQKDDLEDFSKYAISKGAGIKEYNYISPEEATSAITSIMQASDADSAREALDNLKSLGFSEYNSLGKNTKKIVDDAVGKWNLGSYRVGTDSIPYDNYPALLHEGEAVLTASTADELRSLVDEYRNTKYDSAKIEQAINNQTEVLVQRLDAIYSKIPADNESPEGIMPGKLQQNAINLNSTFKAFV